MVDLWEAMESNENQCHPLAFLTGLYYLHCQWVKTQGMRHNEGLFGAKGSRPSWHCMRDNL